MVMLFSKILSELPHTACGGELDRDVRRVVYDSRLVEPGDLFVALRGDTTDGHKYIQQAFDRGAAAVLAEEPVSGPCWAQVPETLSALAEVSRKVYGSPADAMTLIGVTGSNGKSTTTYIIEAIGSQTGRPTGLMGTIEYRWPGFSKPAPHTTPFSSELQEGLAQMKEAGVREVALEVSSHALVLHRVDTLAFDVAVFTNLSHEHLDFHGTMENYAASKLRLFTEFLKPDGIAVLNNDDRWARSWLQEPGLERVITYGFSSSAHVYPEDFALTSRGVEAVLWTPAGRMIVESSFLGRHNLYNLLAGIATGLALGIPVTDIEEAIRSPIPVPGRLESIDLGQPFRVLVDYAHTPDGLKQVLGTLSELPHHRLICVAGAGGDRDRRKRPLMARTAQEMADIVILTSDNPRTEDPEKILDEMELGMVGGAGSTYLRIPNRREAIVRAIAGAEPDDIVLIAGKGHENYQEINKVRYPFDDREEARNALQAAGYRKGKA
jgi:UDP-N-acetylmuramoyl-L-alanyl-D-glutamate--2,6-diaminopimelate ligase